MSATPLSAQLAGFSERWKGHEMLGKYWQVTTAATALWTVVAAMGTAGSMKEDLGLLFWALVVALFASLLSAWLIAVCAASIAVRAERLELEHLASIMANVDSPRRIK